MEGKVIGKVTDEEKEQLKEFKRRDESIYKMLEKLTAQQYKLSRSRPVVRSYQGKVWL